MFFDEFYQDLYRTFFFRWILLNSQSYKKDQIICQIKEISKQLIIIDFDMPQIKGVITIWYNNIIEEEIYQKDSNELLFYLHYIIMNFSQVQNNFQDFYQTMTSHNKEKKYHIALCCSGGLSTAVFVDQMEAVCQKENAPFTLESLAIADAYQQYQNYDALYLAPQIAYLEPKLLSYTKHQVPIYKIDPTDFGTKNYLAIISTIQNHLSI